MHWRKINVEDIPKGTVIARYNSERNSWDKDEPAIGQLVVSKGKVYLELPYYHHDDGCYYREEVNEFITLHDFDHAVEPTPYGT